ncbi:NUDIX domain-containing protein [Dactylosporangium sp. NPDC005572]|uniref:NUDIX domain-containing protein n=1 Tax=Dactylosporangium sp. NPDC005572 TaxID=3156889 RepID=UPI0033A46100
MVGVQVAVGAVVRRGRDVLLVRDGDDWALPGGAVGDGEPLLGRVAAEAGYADVVAERLLWVARYTAGGRRYEMIGFEVTGVGPHGGGGEWVGLDAALQRLEAMWFAPIREPAVAYLSGRARVATLWSWPDLDGPPDTVPPVSPA